ncbi:hypothetical protein DIS24_g12020 [Lasiodiplodia hormozganensis]|uniref:non-specific serine/threonine protein kinase n=1 Tax=Lasiodiplodia hormozganensis TaxID=869390 RepID=A0AA39TU97_9PEZI|nr:hypothetical protein DIS24_g12020 [Lasiodiplodia hormozganensis]
MDYIEGDCLEDVWPDMSPEQKKGIALELKEILIRMRKYVSEDGEEWDIEPPEGVGIGVHGLVRDLRRHDSKTGFHCEDEATFNEFLLAGLPKSTPSDKREQLANGLRSDHRICFTHADLSTRNIIVKGDKIQALLDWEYGGWYPEYWEYVKFLYSHDKHKDWKNYMHLIFPENYAKDYEHELTVYQELWRLQG